MESLIGFVPPSSYSQLEQLLKKNSVEIKITKDRKTKHGDFRINSKGLSSITINQSLNPYRFLITLLHEIAHYKVSITTGLKTKPHGFEWKLAFRETLLPFLNLEIFPDPICSILAKHMKNPKASTDRDFDLVMALKSYDSKKKAAYIFELQNGDFFKIYNGRRFVKIKKLTKRFECKEISTGRFYIFSPHAEVIPE